MTPRFIASAASSSSASRPGVASTSALGHGNPLALSKLAFPSFPRRTTSTSLQINENVPSLLSIYIPESPGGPSQPQPVSLLRGFQATVPSSEKGKERRRKVRGGLAAIELGGGGKGGLGLKKLGMESRGMLTDEASDQQGEDDGPSMSGKERRRRKREKSMGGPLKKGADNAGLGREELLKMEEEIGWDRENIIVRKVSSTSPRSRPPVSDRVACHRRADDLFESETNESPLHLCSSVIISRCSKPRSARLPSRLLRWTRSGPTSKMGSSSSESRTSSSKMSVSHRPKA